MRWLVVRFERPQRQRLEQGSGVDTPQMDDDVVRLEWVIGGERALNGASRRDERPQRGQNEPKRSLNCESAKPNQDQQEKKGYV